MSETIFLATAEGAFAMREQCMERLGIAAGLGRVR
jgi:hypothetical protein